jgi:hypothetical protein
MNRLFPGLIAMSEACCVWSKKFSKRDMIGQASAKKVSTNHTSDKEQPEIPMTKHILLLAAVLGFIAQSSVFAADTTPSPSPSPAKPKATHHHKHHKTTAPAATPSATPKAS